MQGLRSWTVRNTLLCSPAKVRMWQRGKGGDHHSEISLAEHWLASLNPCATPSGGRLKDGYKYERTKAKKAKRTIPAWASISASKKVLVTNFSGSQHKVDDILVEAIMVRTTPPNPVPSPRRPGAGLALTSVSAVSAVL